MYSPAESLKRSKIWVINGLIFDSPLSLTARNRYFKCELHERFNKFEIVAMNVSWDQEMWCNETEVKYSLWTVPLSVSRRGSIYSPAVRDFFLPLPGGGSSIRLW